MSYDFSKTLRHKGQSNESLLLDWFELRGNIPFASYDIQSNAVKFFKNIYNRKVQPDTLNRLWRAMRQEYVADKNNSKLYKHGFAFKEVTQGKGKSWVITNE